LNVFTSFYLLLSFYCIYVYPVIYELRN